MGSEQPAEFYDRYYAKRAKENVVFDWLRQWCVDRLTGTDEHVLEIGCGAGELAAMMAEWHQYLGVDFSSMAIELARQRCPDRDFEMATLPDIELQRSRKFTTAIACEVLEHVNDDRRLIRFIKPGVKVIGTLPSLDSKGHVRVFSSLREIAERYRKRLHFTELVELQYGKAPHYGFVAVRKDME